VGMNSQRKLSNQEFEPREMVSKDLFARQQFGATNDRNGSRVDGALARTFFRCCRLVGCGHVSGLFVRRGWPLALMLSAGQVPIVSTHSKMR
jgi:hypothetical protein